MAARGARVLPAGRTKRSGTIQLRTLKAPGVKTLRGMFNQERLDDAHMALADELEWEPMIGLLQHSHASVRTYSEAAIMQLEKDGEDIILSSAGCQEVYKLLQVKDPNVQSNAMWSLALITGRSELCHDNIIKDIGWLTFMFFARSDAGGGYETQIASVSAISNLCLNEDLHEMIIKEGGLDLLKSIGKSTTDIRMKRPIAIAFANLATCPESVSDVVAGDGLDLIIKFAADTDDELVSGGIHTIANLADTPAMRKPLLDAGALPVAVRLLGSRDALIVKGATAAVAHLAPDYAEDLVRQGAPQPLAHLAKIAKNPEIQLRTAAAIATLAKNPQTREAIRAAGVVRPLRSLARSRNEDIKKEAIDALTALGETFSSRSKKGSLSISSSTNSDDDDDDDGAGAGAGVGGESDEARRRREEEEAAAAARRRREEEEAAARRRAEEEEARKRHLAAEEETRRRLAAEEEEARRKQQAEEEARRRSAATSSSTSAIDWDRDRERIRLATEAAAREQAQRGVGPGPADGARPTGSPSTVVKVEHDYGSFAASPFFSSMAGATSAPSGEEDLKITLVEPLPRPVEFSFLNLKLEDNNRTLKLTMEWVDEHDPKITRTRRVMWDFTFTAHPMYVDAFYKDHTFTAHVYKPKPDGQFRRLIVPGFILPANPSSGRSRVEVVPRSGATEIECTIQPSTFQEKGRVYLEKGDELRFVFEHEETQMENGVKYITDLTTTRYINLPSQVPSGTIFFSLPDKVTVMRRFAAATSPEDIQIINLDARR